jgi:hypothetical protein
VLAGALPNFFTLYKVVRLLPEFYFRIGFIIPAIADNAVVGWPFAGELG